MGFRRLVVAGSAVVWGVVAFVAPSPAARGAVCDAYPAASPAYVKVNPIPMAGPGTLPPAGSVAVQVVANDIAGNCVSGAPVYLYFAGQGTAVPGTAARCPVGGTGSLTPNWAACTTDRNGAVPIVYGTPSVLPNDGFARLDAAPAMPSASNNGVVETTYTYASLSVRAASPAAVEGAAFSGVVGTVTTLYLPPGTGLSATIDWGDGAASGGTILTAGAINLYQVTGSHVYAEENMPGTAGYPISVTVSARSGPSATATGLVGVVDAPVSATGVSVSGKVHRLVTGTVARFTDADPAGVVGDFAATVSWGDGTSSVGVVSAVTGGGFTVTGSHTYAKRGNFAVSVRVGDVGGATATASATASIR